MIELNNFKRGPSATDLTESSRVSQLVNHQERSNKKNLEKNVSRTTQPFSVFAPMFYFYCYLSGIVIVIDRFYRTVVVLRIRASNSAHNQSFEP